MTEQTPGRKPSTTDQILDLLLDALAERQKVREGEAGPSPRPSPVGEAELSPPPQPSPSRERETPPSALPSPSMVRETQPAALPSPSRERESAPSPLPSPAREAELSPSPLPSPAREAELSPSPLPSPSREREERRRPGTLAEAARREPLPGPERAPGSGEKGWQPPARLPSIQMGRLLGRLAIAVAILVVLINIPVKGHGVSLARILPDTASLIIRDGLVLKGTGTEIYILQDDKLRWISSIDVFEHLGLTWADVHVIDDAFLEQFEMGHPIHLILKCDGSPHIYALENGQKRWIQDIDTFTAEGYVWEDVQLVTCPYLRGLPDGLPIPEDAGAPPQP